MSIPMATITSEKGLIQAGFYWRENDGVRVEEFGGAIVVSTEGNLRLLSGIQVEPEELLVLADTRDVDDRLAVRRPGRT